MRSSRFISLGHDCQAAYQIRRATQSKSSYFYDWLLTPLNSCNLIEIDDTQIFKPGNWAIQPDGKSVLDKGTGLSFVHEFALKDKVAELVDENLVESQLDDARRKFIHLKHKTLREIQGAKRCILVRRHEQLTDALAAEKAANYILQSYRKINPDVKLVLVSSPKVYESFHPHYTIVGVSQNKLSNNGGWHGDDDSWDRVFDLAHK